MLENKMLLIGIVAAVVIIAGVAGFLLMKKPTPVAQPTEEVTEENVTTEEVTPTTPTTEADIITNIPEGVTGEQTTDTAYYYKEEAPGTQTSFDITKVGLSLDTTTNNFELQILLSKEKLTLTDAQEIADRIMTRLNYFATDLTKNIVEGENYYKIIITGTATDVDGLKAEVKTYRYY